MKRRNRCLILITCLAFIVVASADSKKQAAETAANDWLMSVDSRQCARSHYGTPSFAAAVAETIWAQNMPAVRASVGTLALVFSRTHLAAYRSQLPGSAERQAHRRRWMKRSVVVLVVLLLAFLFGVAFLKLKHLNRPY